MPQWKEFEHAVATFVAALDPSAKVQHNAFLPDRQTGNPRQRDVWIEAKAFQHFPLRILISCKRFKRKLHEGDIDTFFGELQSSSAHLGVIYSYSSFRPAALDKARELNIACCRLYQNEPPEIPDVLALKAFCCTPTIAVSVNPCPLIGWPTATWLDLFGMPVAVDGDKRTVIDELVGKYHDAEKYAVEQISKDAPIPKGFVCTLTLEDTDSSRVLTLSANGQWRVYQARLDAYLVKGSYELTGKDFKGEICTPVVDLLGDTPGPGWELCSGTPSNTDNSLVMVMFHGDAKKALLEKKGPQSIGGSPLAGEHNPQLSS